MHGQPAILYRFAVDVGDDVARLYPGFVRGATGGNRLHT